MGIRPYHFYIENFRNFRDTSFDLGQKITVVKMVWVNQIFYR